MGEERDIGRESRSDIICLEGNGYRPSHKGDGWIVGGAMYTLNGTEVHAVCYAIDQQGGKGGANYLKNICPTILSDSHGTPHAVCYAIDHVVTGGGNAPIVVKYEESICGKEVL